MEIVCLDLEGVLVPEIWLGVADITGIDELKATTREIPDYDQLMKRRLEIMSENDLGLSIIQKVVKGFKPLEGAKEFLEWLNTEFQVVILSDTFYEFSKPLMRQLEWPTLFCHRLETNASGKIVNYHLRMRDHKREAVKALKALNFKVYAVGDSYNDVSMLMEADVGIFFRASTNVIQKFPELPFTTEYNQLKKALIEKNLFRKGS